MDNLFETIKTIERMAEHGKINNILRSLTVHSMRRFHINTTIDFLFPLTVLVGKNGSGKTTIMKMIQMLSNYSKPELTFFETAIDNGGMDNASFSLCFDDTNLECKHIGINKWSTNGKVPQSMKIVYLNPKTMVGAFEKSFLYDDIGKKTKKEQQVDYVIRQSKKFNQNKLKKSEKKIERQLNSDTVTMVNYILQLNVSEIRIVKHKYFSGTWATNVFFSDGVEYSEYNAGSGEFLIALMLDKIFKLQENTLLLLDEPEVSLHPGAQKRFMQCLVSAIKKKKIQVIMTTHSANIVDGLPSKAIVALRRVNNFISAEGNLNYQYAFTEIEEDVTQKCIIVEDIMGKKIIDEIIKEESLGNYLQVMFFSGGAENIKKHTIFTYSKTQIDNRFIIFDGDQKPAKDIPDFSTVLEKDKTLDYYKKIFKEIVGVDSKSIEWGVDANRKKGRVNEEQEKSLILAYLEFYRNNVKFLPSMIPEDLIIDLDKLKAVCVDLPQIDEKADSKAKIKAISEATKYEYSGLISILTTAFVKKKDENYWLIVTMLREIIEGSVL